MIVQVCASERLKRESIRAGRPNPRVGKWPRPMPGGFLSPPPRENVPDDGDGEVGHDGDQFAPGVYSLWTGRFFCPRSRG